MDADKLNRWLTLAANIAVLAGIFFLAAEISQNTDMMRAQINQSRAEALMNSAQSMYNSQHLPEILVKLRQGNQITAVERERYTHFLRGLHKNLDNQLRQYREGFLADYIPHSIRGAILDQIVENDLAKQEWNRTRQHYSEEYADYVDSILAEYAE